jgi:hypothetical protein
LRDAHGLARPATTGDAGLLDKAVLSHGPLISLGLSKGDWDSGDDERDEAELDQLRRTRACEFSEASS